MTRFACARSIGLLFAVLLVVGSMAAVGSAQDVATRTFSVPGVDAITIRGGGSITLTVGDTTAITIEGPAEAVEQLDVRISADEVEIAPIRGTTPELGQDLVYTITVATLSRLELRDDVTLTGIGLTESTLSLELRGRASATLDDLAIGTLSVELRDQAELTLAGEAGDLDAELRQASQLHAADLVVQRASIEARDAATAELQVSERLEGEARNMAAIQVIGGPGAVDVETRDQATVTLVTAVGATPEAAGDPSAGGVHTVSVVDFAFMPRDLTISVGDRVTWTNDGDAKHTVTADGGAFDSGIFDSGGSFSFTFDQAGSFPYRCLLHPEMIGVVEVVSR